MGLGDMLQAERDAEDARRYRWLKEHLGASGGKFHETAFDIRAGNILPERWDQCIDAALAHQPPSQLTGDHHG